MVCLTDCYLSGLVGLSCGLLCCGCFGVTRCFGVLLADSVVFRLANVVWVKACMFVFLFNSFVVLVLWY